MNTETVFAGNEAPTVIHIGELNKSGDGREFIDEVEVKLIEERCIDGIHRTAEDECVAV
jgi:hypothetical protein